nr:MAG TPA: hypothetical protein [Caudoviricetes sp.]
MQTVRTIAARRQPQPGEDTHRTPQGRKQNT